MRKPSPKNSTSSRAGKTTPCCVKVGLKRGPWTPEEDEVLSSYINKEGEGRWRTLPKRAGLLRCGKSCRLRWMNYLRPSVKRGQIASDEEDLILRLHRLLGNRWSLIAGRIPGRTDNEIKNYWNTHLSKKLISQGIDPRTHKPLTNPPDNTTDDKDKHKPFSSSSKPHEGLPALGPGYTGLSNCEATDSGGMELMMTRRNNNHTDVMANYHQKLLIGGDNEDEEEDMNNYCTDDVFSSFINSLINEEAFASQHQQPGGIGIVPASDPLLASTFGIANGWESAVMSSSIYSQTDHNKVSE